MPPMTHTFKPRGLNFYYNLSMFKVKYAKYIPPKRKLKYLY